MIKQNFFLTTRTDQNNMYKFIIGMCYKDANHTRKKKLEIKQLKFNNLKIFDHDFPLEI